MYMQTDAAILESNRHKRKVKRAVAEKGQELDLWLYKNGIPRTRNSEIMERIQQELAERREVAVENILSILPHELQRYMESCMPLARLRKVPMLQTMDEEVLQAICERLQPRRKDSAGFYYLSRDGEPLENMVFIVEGDLGVERRNIRPRDLLYPGDFYGAELLEWVSVSSTSFPATLPLSIDSAYIAKNDSILILTADDLKIVVSNFRSHFSKEINIPSSPQSARSFYQSTMLNLPQFQSMDEEILSDICERLKVMTYTDGEYMIKEDQPLQLMFVVLAGYVVTESYPHVVVRIGEFCGQEFLDWPSTNCFPTVLPTAVESARANGDVRVLALTSDDWVSIVNKFDIGSEKRRAKLEMEKKVAEFELWLFKSAVPRSRKNEIIQMVRGELEENEDVNVENILSILPEDLQNFIDGCLPMSRLKKVPMLQTMDEQVLQAICERLQPRRQDSAGFYYLSRDGEPLENMVFIVEGDLGVERRNIRPRDLLYPGDFYGAELLEWVSVSSTSFPATLPLSIDSAYIAKNDSILILTANDLKMVVSNFRSHFSKEITLPPNSRPEILTSFQLTLLKTVPPFQAMEGEMLRAICERLKVMTYTDGEYIIKKDQPLQLMFFLLAGYVVTESYPHVVVRIGEFCGGHLLDWPSTTSFPATLPTALESARANGDVKVLALRTEDWVSVVNEYS